MKLKKCSILKIFNTWGLLHIFINNIKDLDCLDKVIITIYYKLDNKYLLNHSQKPH